jgi:hypothetical protein
VESQHCHALCCGYFKDVPEMPRRKSKMPRRIQMCVAARFFASAVS